MSYNSKVTHGVDDGVVRIEVQPNLEPQSAELRAAIEAINQGRPVLLVPMVQRPDEVLLQSARARPTIRTIWTWPWTGIDLITVLTGGVAFGSMAAAAAPHTPWVSFVTAALGMVAARVAKIFDK